MSFVRRYLLVAAALGTFALTAVAQLPTPAEQRTARAFDAAKKLGKPALYAFLEPMPKGADLHMHLSGAVYAETFLREAVVQGLCVDTATLSLAAPQASKSCAKPELPAADILKDQHLYDALVDSFSMRGFVPTPGVTGHDQFFATFARFGAAKNPGEWLDEVATRAATQNEQYLEIMQTPSFGHAAVLGYKLGWPTDATVHISINELVALRTALLSLGLKDEVTTDIKELSGALAARAAIEHCPAMQNVTHSPCSVEIHFLYQVLRAFPPQQVFAQTLLGFEVAEAAHKANPASPLVVGINFVQPEDDRRAMADYHLQMQMLDYLHSVYPDVKLSLHAGELALGLVPPEGLTFHIHEAIDLGHASRIGHGVDVMYEHDAPALLKQMAAQHIMVEINLTSNDVILGVKGNDHPLHSYMAAHVPWALSTDDEGVNRSDLTHEYVKGAFEQDLSYLDLKRSARTSLEHAFLAGSSLWAKPDDFAHRIDACAAPITASSKLTSTCETFLNSNEKAAAQYELEHRFVIFEAEQH
ncbi:adenosine deaminase [Granulicella sp. 5B5]|uniref:adenosine deaminase n=1 Tax=Granulicella sp. 5B5 TaxID=1617967 RepID=UPI0015F4F57C|nr:adenosine deaminase [Granulicella sp. 5B5]QMV19488.1 adenosine deaminase [Granulicella sp. 5B5]